MKFLIAFLLTALLSFVACLYLPWYSIAIVAFLVALLVRQHAGKAYLAAFLALFVLWAGISAWLNNANDSILAHRISLLVIKTDNPIMLIVITGLLGAVVAGFAALSGSLLLKRK
ncbi:MAG: hypothetical protein ABIY51_13240 [Ferruginibacter sp.]